MLIYIILMLALAYFFQKEGQKLLAGKSKLLAEFCQDAYATKTALSTLRILCLSSAVSGFWMLIAFLLSKTIHKFLTPFALLSTFATASDSSLPCCGSESCKQKPKESLP